MAQSPPGSLLEMQSAASNPPSPATLPAHVSVLVAIASYGRKQDHYLARVISQYGALKGRCRIVVLSEAEKPVEGAEVLAGLPTRNTYSLPFAHRKLFQDNVDKFDLFVYTEDDTLLTPAHMASFLEAQKHLNDDEIVGFMRSETSPTGETYVTSVNHFFRWLPETASMRGSKCFADFSNHHSGCFIVTQAQLRRALASGGFMVPPHDERYGMLESAASDIYTQCGFRRLLCLSGLQEFIVPHLPNKYFHEMGIAAEELQQQIDVLCGAIRARDVGPPLCEPQTRAYGFRWSKNLYEKPDDVLLSAIPSGTRRVLSIGVGSGETEQWLAKRGIEVHAMAIDSVFAGTLRAKGISAVAGDLTLAAAQLERREFDVILATDVLHLAQNPVHWLETFRAFLAPQGVLLARVPNTGELTTWFKDLKAGRRRRRFPRYADSGAHAVSRSTLARWCAAAGYEPAEILPLVHPSKRRRLGSVRVPAIEALVADKFLITARVARALTAPTTP